MESEAPFDDNPLHSISVESLMQTAPGWDQLLALFNNNRRLLEDVLALMAQEALRLSKDFCHAVEARDCRAAQRAAHTLKSNARQLAWLPTADFFGQLEKLAAQGQLAALAEHTQAVAQMGSAIADWSRELLDRHRS